MTTYNGHAYLAEQLASLASQTLKPDELAVSDDHSTDETTAIVRDFAKTAPFPVKLRVNPTGLGWAANFMAAAAMCSGDLIAFCDQDDVWRPEKLLRVKPFFADPDVVMVCHDAAVVNAQLEYIRPLARLPPKLVHLKPLELGPWQNALGFTQVIRRELTAYVDLWPHSLDHDRRPSPMAHDQWFSFLASVLGTMVYIPDALASYRQHGNNAVGNNLPPASPLAWDTMRINAALTAAQAKASEARERVLTLLLPRTEGAAQMRVRKAMDRYERLSRQLRLRAELYSSPSLPSRCASLSRLLKSGYYVADGQWTLGPKSLIKDVAVGVPFGSRLSQA